MKDGQCMEGQESANGETPRLGVALRAAAPFARARLLSDAIRERLCDRLGLLPSEVQDESRFMDLGIDSMVAVEVQVFLADETGVHLKSTVIFDYPTIGRLVTYILQRMDVGQPVAPPTPTVEREAARVDKRQGGADVAESLAKELREIEALLGGGQNG